MAKKTVNLGFRVTPERARELRLISADRGEKIQQMLESGLDLLLSESIERHSDFPQEHHPGQPVVPKKLIPIVEWFVDLMSEPGDEEQEALKQTLRVLAIRRSARVHGKDDSAKKRNAS